VFDDTCPVCGGDGRIETAHRKTPCPACHGSGRRAEQTGFRDVTKTKPSHHQPAVGPGQKAPKKTWPSTHDGAKLADEVKASDLPDNEKARLTQNIIDYEDRKGLITKTFSRIIRKQVRNPEK
jgi:hypothetical protein